MRKNKQLVKKKREEKHTLSPAQMPRVLSSRLWSVGDWLVKDLLDAKPVRDATRGQKGQGLGTDYGQLSPKWVPALDPRQLWDLCPQLEAKTRDCWRQHQNWSRPHPLGQVRTQEAREVPGDPCQRLPGPSSLHRGTPLPTSPSAASHTSATASWQPGHPFEFLSWEVKGRALIC